MKLSWVQVAIYDIFFEWICFRAGFLGFFEPRWQVISVRALRKLWRYFGPFSALWIQFVRSGANFGFLEPIFGILVFLEPIGTNLGSLHLLEPFRASLGTFGS